MTAETWTIYDEATGAVLSEIIGTEAAARKQVASGQNMVAGEYQRESPLEQITITEDAGTATVMDAGGAVVEQPPVRLWWNPHEQGRPRRWTAWPRQWS